MRIEHFAINAPDPVAMADWYEKHLAMRVVRFLDVAPFTRFLADDAGRTVVEIYAHEKAPIPDYFAMDPLMFHIAFVSTDVRFDCDRLIKAGAKAAGEITTTPVGDEMVFLHDPWGVGLQLVRRANPLPV